MSKHRRHALTKNLILALMLLVIANTIMGLSLALQSRYAIQTLIHQRMLDISNTAAAMIDGDAMKDLTKEDAGSYAYEQALSTLRVFQENIELEYIYAINVEEDGTFTFSVDPAIEDPGEFGSPVITTKALQQAAAGKAAVDQQPYEDEWGRFYSAYSPVYDSEWNVPVVVAVDFSAEWVENQISQYVLTITIVIGVSLFLGIWLALFISSKSRKRFSELNSKMADLEEGFKELNKIMMKSSIQKLELISDDNHRELLQTIASGEIYGTEDDEDEISEIGMNLHSMQKQLKRYISFLYSQTYKDEMTGVNNKSAYQLTIKNMNQAIAEKRANFAVGFFDINELKAINTNYGFEIGDELLLKTAALLKEIFISKNVYRIASDEFIIIIENKTKLDMKDYFQRLDGKINQYNAEHKDYPDLSVAKGLNVFQPEESQDYRQVLIKAEAAMREDKAEFYKQKYGPEEEEIPEEPPVQE